MKLCDDLTQWPSLQAGWPRSYFGKFHIYIYKSIPPTGSVHRRPGGYDTVCWLFAGRTHIHTLIRMRQDAFVLHCLTSVIHSSLIQCYGACISQTVCWECASSCCTRQQQRQHVVLFSMMVVVTVFLFFSLFFFSIIKLHRQNLNFLSFAFWWLKVQYVELMWRQGGFCLFVGNLKSNRWLYVQERWYCLYSNPALTTDKQIG